MNAVLYNYMWSDSMPFFIFKREANSVHILLPCLFFKIVWGRRHYLPLC